MKKIFFIGPMLFLFAAVCVAETITLNSPETFQKTATSIVWRKVIIDATAKKMQVQYSWRDADGANITPYNGGYVMTWTCADRQGNPDTPEDDSDSCFSDTFGFVIRAQDAGKTLGAGLRTLIWNKMKDDVLSGGNDGTIE